MRLVSTCRQLYDSIDEEVQAEHEVSVALSQSQERVKSQRSMAEQIQEENRALQESLDKTMRKFSEVSTAYAQIQSELARDKLASDEQIQQEVAERGRANIPRQVEATRLRAQALVQEIDGQEREVLSLKRYRDDLASLLAAERSHAVRLEEFVLKLASAPLMTRRTGGGYKMNSPIQLEAVTLLDELRTAALSRDQEMCMSQIAASIGSDARPTEPGGTLRPEDVQAPAVFSLSTEAYRQAYQEALAEAEAAAAMPAEFNAAYEEVAAAMAPSASSAADGAPYIVPSRAPVVR